MENKKFDKITIIMGAVSLALAVFCLPVESILLSAVNFVLCAKRSGLYREKLSRVLAAASIIVAVIILGIFICFSSMQGFAAADYWFLRIFFDMPA